MKSTTTGILMCILLVSSFARADEGKGHERGPWYIGFGIGGGDGAWTTRTNEYIPFGLYFSGFKSSRTTFNFKVGATLTPRLLAGFDVTAIREAGKQGNTDSSAQIGNLNGVVTFFPRETGVFFRGGLGLADFSMDTKDPSGRVRRHISGFDGLMGAGYAFWLLKSFNLTLNFDYSRQFYRSSFTMPEESHFYTLYLGFDWY